MVPALAFCLLLDATVDGGHSFSDYTTLSRAKGIDDAFAGCNVGSAIRRRRYLLAPCDQSVPHLCAMNIIPLLYFITF